MFSYTFYCVLLICCSQVFSNEDVIFTKPVLTCMKQIDMSKEEIMELFDENFHVVKDRPKLKEILACTIKEKKLLKEDGTINREAIYDEVLNGLIPWLNKGGDKVAIANKVTDECIGVDGDFLEDRFANINDCLMDGIRKY